ncbi:hypothetical protein WA026_011978 [Henosepilachna vigintioctopunctata]|uniref:Zinc finger CW-type PWWP domain protein 1 n=1 Tax=Henosepilachna vigintioctopunctata TaxID=420089 RepID=A0AAW1VEL5_9CUCU
MPLYKRHVRQLYSSQKTDTTQEEPEVKTLKISSLQHQGKGSQTAIDNILNINNNLRSPSYPEALPRTASQPYESAFSESEIFDQNKTFKSGTSKIESYEESNEQCTAKSKSEEIHLKSTPESIVLSQNTKHKIPEKEDNLPKNNNQDKQFFEKRPLTKSQKKLKLGNETKKESKETNNEKNSYYQTPNIPSSTKSQNSYQNDKSTESFNVSHNSSLFSQELNLSNRKYGDLLNSSLNSSLNDSGKENSLKRFQIDEKKIRSKNESLLSQRSDISMSDPVVKNAYMKFMKNKEKFCRFPTPKGLEHKQKLRWLHQQRNVGVFVHCDKCDKIRYLDDIKDPLLLPKKWYCQKNPDELHNKCEIPEEKFPAHVQADWIDNIYNAGSLVWARLEGFPWWPAIVDDDPDTECYYWLDDEINNTPSYYNVTFFDKKEVSRAWLKPDAIKPFLENFENLPLNYNLYKDRLDVAIKQAKEASKMPLLERLEEFSFIARYKKAINKPKDVKLDGKNNKLKKTSVILNALNKGKTNEISKRNRRAAKKAEKKKNHKEKKLVNATDPYDASELFDDFLPSPSLGDISLELFDDV